MHLRQWFAENIGYRFFGCEYNSRTGPIFDFLESKVPRSFLGKRVADLGCGDGTNTLRIKRIFRPKEIVGYERNDYLIERVKKLGIKVHKSDLNKWLPHGEMATFIFSIHHFTNIESVLLEAKKNFRYIVICDPIRDLYHILFDAGQPRKVTEWKKLLDRAFKKYNLFLYRNTVIMFYENISP